MVEQMLHPFSNVPCDVRRLVPGDVLAEGDVYVSVTIISPRTGFGVWQAVTSTMAGSTIGKECNVGFMRLTPIVLQQPVASIAAGIDTGT